MSFGTFDPESIRLLDLELKERRRTLEQIEFDLIVAEHLDDAIECEDETCPLEASWSYAHTCGETWLLCIPHRVMMDDTMRKWKQWGRTTYCDKCDGSMPYPLPWLPV